MSVHAASISSHDVAGGPYSARLLAQARFPAVRPAAWRPEAGCQPDLARPSSGLVHSGDAVLRAAVPLWLSSDLLSRLPGRRAAGGNARRHSSWRQPAVLRLERAVVRPSGVRLGLGGSLDRAPHRPVTGGIGRGADVAHPRRAGESRHPVPFQVHAVPDREPEPAPARVRGPLAFRPRHPPADRRVLHRLREDHLPCRRPSPGEPAGRNPYDLPAVCLLLPEAAGRSDHQVPRDG